MSLRPKLKEPLNLGGREERRPVRSSRELRTQRRASRKGGLVTQEKNRDYINPPKPGDGTLRENRLEPEANWFGPAEAPQEEFIENSPVPPSPEELARKNANTSEGKPTFSRSGSGEEDEAPMDKTISRGSTERPGK